MLRMPIAERHRQSSLRNSNVEYCQFGVTVFPVGQALQLDLPRVDSACQGGVSFYITVSYFIDVAIRVFTITHLQQTVLKADETTPGLPPC
jgi:hypothetical protein